MDFAVPAVDRVKIKESEMIGKYLDLAWELKKKAVEHDGDCDTNCSWCTWKIEEIGNQRKNRNHADYNIVEIG